MKIDRPASPLPQSVVLVVSPHAGRAAELPRAREALARAGFALCETIPVAEVGRVRAWVERPDAERPLIVAAGGDGTVGAVAGYVATTPAVLGILPLGTANNVARSLGVPLDIEAAVGLLATGKIATVDAGRFVTSDGARIFVQTAMMGLGVDFARLATQVSLRRRFGHLTYLVATALALHRHRPFACDLHIDGRAHQRRSLLHLSIINAPIFGGIFGLRLPGSGIDNRTLDVLSIEDVPLWHLLFAFAVARLRPHWRVGGVRVYRARALRVHTEVPVDVSLDGEVVGRLPGDFALAPEALRVVAPLAFEDIDDDDAQP